MFGRAWKESDLMGADADVTGRALQLTRKLQRSRSENETDPTWPFWGELWRFGEAQCSATKLRQVCRRTTSVQEIGKK